MQLYIRRILLVISYTTFALLAPLIVLYAMGYRPTLSSPIPSPVGVLLLDSFPKKASATVQEKNVGILPRAVPNLAPGIVQAIVQKSGYIPWKKNLEIKPVQATDMRAIRLLPEHSDEEQILPDTKIATLFSSTGLIASVDSKNSFSISDSTGLPISNTLQLKQTPTQLAWSTDGQSILLTFPKQSYSLVTLTNKTAKLATLPLLTGARDVHFSSYPPGIIFGISPSYALISYSIDTNTITTTAKNVNAYATYERTLFYQTVDNELISHQIGGSTQRVLLPDTKKNITSINASSSGNIAIKFGDGELAIVTPDQELISIVPFAAMSEWSPNGEMLLIQTSPSELQLYSLEQNRGVNITERTLHFITRLSTPIHNPAWFGDGEHILYETDGKLIFSEIDTRDHAIAQPISTSPALGFFLYSEQKNKSILYLQNENGTDRLMRLWLVTPEDR